MKTYKIRIEEYIGGDRYEYKELYSQVVDIENKPLVFTIGDAEFPQVNSVDSSDYIKNIIKAVNNI